MGNTDNSHMAFWANYKNDDIRDTGNEISLNKNEIIERMKTTLCIPHNFFGIVYHNDSVIQFYVCDDKTIDVDIPVPEREGSVVYNTNLEECLEIIMDIPEFINNSDQSKMKFVSWS